MTMPYSPSRVVYEGNDAATRFPFSFKVWDASQLVVTLTSPGGVTTEASGWTADLGATGGEIVYLHGNAAPCRVAKLRQKGQKKERNLGVGDVHHYAAPIERHITGKCRVSGAVRAGIPLGNLGSGCPSAEREPSQPQQIASASSF